MAILIPDVAVSPLRQPLIDEVDIRRFGPETQRNYVRDVGRLRRSWGARRTQRRRKKSGASRSSSATWARDAATPSRVGPSAPADPTSPPKSGQSASRSALASSVPSNTAQLRTLDGGA